jgi:hypothetical protein
MLSISMTDRESDDDNWRENFGFHLTNRRLVATCRWELTLPSMGLRRSDGCFGKFFRRESMGGYRQFLQVYSVTCMERKVNPQGSDMAKISSNICIT